MAVMAGCEGLVCEGRGCRGVVYVAVVLSVLEPIWSSLYKRENELYLRHKPIIIYTMEPCKQGTPCCLGQDVIRQPCPKALTCLETQGTPLQMDCALSSSV